MQALPAASWCEPTISGQCHISEALTRIQGGAAHDLGIALLEGRPAEEGSPTPKSQDATAMAGSQPRKAGADTDARVLRDSQTLRSCEVVHFDNAATSLADRVSLVWENRHQAELAQP